MIKVPVAPSASQTMSVVVGGQACEIALRQNGANIYFDLRANGEYIVRTRIVRNKQLLLLDAKYRKFNGDFIFIDTLGDTQPEYSGLGTRYLLYYVAPIDIPAND